jgi:hypothetical protein
MPTEGRAYPITPEWKEWVRERLDELGINQSELGRRISKGRSVISEMLGEDSVQSPLVPDVHKALGWPPPLLTPPIHILQMVDVFQRLDPLTQGQWMERMRHAVQDERTKRGR